MNRGIIIGVVLLIFGGFYTNAQNCDSLYRIVESYFDNTDEDKPFITDGQIYTTFLDNKKVEFNTILYSNYLYRIAISAGAQENFAIFTILDMNNNILFSNKEYNNSPYWDFKTDYTMPVKIQAELDTNKKITGCFVLMIGFQK